MPSVDDIEYAVSELEEAVREREHAEREYDDILSDFEAADENKTEAENVEAEARRAFTALCFEVVRVEADTRLSHFLLCENNDCGQRLILALGLDKEALRRERDRIVAEDAARRPWLVQEEYVRVASRIRHDL